MSRIIIQSLCFGLFCYGVSLWFRGGLSGKPLFDIVHSLVMIVIVSGTHFWINRRAQSAP